MTYSGGCLCGKVRYATDAGVAFGGNCHCRDCQRATGGGYAPVTMFPAGAVAITGKPRYFTSNGDSGNLVERGFCKDCGAQLFLKLAAIPAMFGIRPGTLDDPSLYRPSSISTYPARSPGPAWILGFQSAHCRRVGSGSRQSAPMRLPMQATRARNVPGQFEKHGVKTSCRSDVSGAPLAHHRVRAVHRLSPGFGGPRTSIRRGSSMHSSRALSGMA